MELRFDAMWYSIFGIENSDVGRISNVHAGRRFPALCFRIRPFPVLFQTYNFKYLLLLTYNPGLQPEVATGQYPHPKFPKTYVVVRYSNKLHHFSPENIGWLRPWYNL